MKSFNRIINIFMNRDPDSGLKGSTGLNLIQVGVVVVLIPAFGAAYGAMTSRGVAGGSAQLLTGLLANVPLLATCMDLLCQSIGVGLDIEGLLAADALLMIKAFPEAILSILCVRFFTVLSDRIKKDALHIFAAFFGIVTASFISQIFGSNKEALKAIIFEIGVIIIMLIGMWILFRSVFHYSGISKAKIVLLYIIDGLLAIYTTTYAAGFLLAFSGYFGSFGRAFARMFVLGVIEIILGVVVFFIHQAVDKDIAAEG